MNMSNPQTDVVIAIPIYDTCVSLTLTFSLDNRHIHHSIIQKNTKNIYETINLYLRELINTHKHSFTLQAVSSVLRVTIDTYIHYSTTSTTRMHH